MTNSTEATTKKTPDYNIHVSVPNGRSTRVGPRIGVAFKHKSGDGLTIYLNAQPIPVDGQIELVAFVPEA